jgi:hypothetical protein
MPRSAHVGPTSRSGSTATTAHRATCRSSDGYPVFDASRSTCTTSIGSTNSNAASAGAPGTGRLRSERPEHPLQGHRHTREPEIGATRSKKPDMAPARPVPGSAEAVRRRSVQEHRGHRGTHRTRGPDPAFRDDAGSALRPDRSPSSGHWTSSWVASDRWTARSARRRSSTSSLWQIRTFEAIEDLGDFPGFQHLFLQSLPLVTRFPDMSRSANLRRIELMNMKGLRDFTSIERAPRAEGVQPVRRPTATARGPHPRPTQRQPRAGRCLVRKPSAQRSLPRVAVGVRQAAMDRARALQLRLEPGRRPCGHYGGHAPRLGRESTSTTHHGLDGLPRTVTSPRSRWGTTPDLFGRLVAR